MTTDTHFFINQALPDLNVLIPLLLIYFSFVFTVTPQSTHRRLGCLHKSKSPYEPQVLKNIKQYLILLDDTSKGQYSHVITVSKQTHLCLLKVNVISPVFFPVVILCSWCEANVGLSLSFIIINSSFSRTLLTCTFLNELQKSHFIFGWHHQVGMERCSNHNCKVHKSQYNRYKSNPRIKQTVQGIIQFRRRCQKSQKTQWGRLIKWERMTGTLWHEVTRKRGTVWRYLVVEWGNFHTWEVIVRLFCILRFFFDFMFQVPNSSWDLNMETQNSLSRATVHSRLL